MQTLADFLKNVSVTSGFVNDEFSHGILANPELVKVELPDGFVTAFNGKYLTEESAKANPNIKNHFVSTALNPIDAKLEEIMTEMEFSDADKDEVKKEKSTYKKNELVIKKIKAMSSKSTSEEDKVKFTKEVTRLNGELVKAGTEKDTAIKQLNDGWVTKLSNSTLTSMIISQPLYTTDTMDVEDVTTLAHKKLEKALQEKKAAKVFDSDTLTFKLVQKDNPDLPYFEGGKEVTFNAFLQKTLADSKLLKTTTTASTTTEKKTTFVNTNRTDGDKEQSPAQRRIKSSVDEDLANLTAAGN